MLPPTRLVEILFRLQEGKCFHCGTEMSNMVYTVDNRSGWTREHITPRAHGGGNTKNIVLSCAPCNKNRGTKMLSDVAVIMAVRLANKAWSLVGNKSYTVTYKDGSTFYYGDK